jgi:hypothetical protein
MRRWLSVERLGACFGKRGALRVAQAGRVCVGRRSGSVGGLWLVSQDPGRVDEAQGEAALVVGRDGLGHSPFGLVPEAERHGFCEVFCGGLLPRASFCFMPRGLQPSSSDPCVSVQAGHPQVLEHMCDLVDVRAPDGLVVCFPHPDTDCARVDVGLPVELDNLPALNLNGPSRRRQFERELVHDGLDTL